MDAASHGLIPAEQDAPALPCPAAGAGVPAGTGGDCRGRCHARTRASGSLGLGWEDGCQVRMKGLGAVEAECKGKASLPLLAAMSLPANAMVTGRWRS